MIPSDYLPFTDNALNASFIAICFLLIPFPLMVFSAIRMKLVTKKNLLLFGLGFITLSILITPMFAGIIDLISSFENKVQECQAEYVYRKLAELGQLPTCDGLSKSELNDLSGFKDFIIMASVVVTVIVLSLGVNLIASAIALSQERLALEELYNKVDEIKLAVDKQTRVLSRFLFSIVLLLIIAVVLVIYANG